MRKKNKPFPPSEAEKTPNLRKRAIPNNTAHDLIVQAFMVIGEVQMSTLPNQSTLIHSNLLDNPSPLPAPSDVSYDSEKNGKEKKRNHYTPWTATNHSDRGSFGVEGCFGALTLKTLLPKHLPPETSPAHPSESHRSPQPFMTNLPPETSHEWLLVIIQCTAPPFNPRIQAQHVHTVHSTSNPPH